MLCFRNGQCAYVIIIFAISHSFSCISRTGSTPKAWANKNIDSILKGPLPHSISETRALDILAFSASSLCVRLNALR